MTALSASGIISKPSHHSVDETVGLPQELLANIAVVEALAAKAAE
ncbi:MAG TPA: hypothetical protein VI636_07115 [Candidatus Angelobacter sp.]